VLLAGDDVVPAQVSWAGPRLEPAARGISVSVNATPGAGRAGQAVVPAKVGAGRVGTRLLPGAVRATPRQPVQAVVLVLSPGGAVVPRGTDLLLLDSREGPAVVVVRFAHDGPPPLLGQVDFGVGNARVDPRPVVAVAVQEGGGDILRRIVAGQGGDVRALAPAADGHAEGALDRKGEQRRTLVAQLVDDAVGADGLVEYGLALLLERVAEPVLVVDGHGEVSPQRHLGQEDVVAVVQLGRVGRPVDVHVQRAGGGGIAEGGIVVVPVLAGRSCGVVRAGSRRLEVGGDGPRPGPRLQEGAALVLVLVLVLVLATLMRVGRIRIISCSCGGGAGDGHEEQQERGDAGDKGGGGGHHHLLCAMILSCSFVFKIQYL